MKQYKKPVNGFLLFAVGCLILIQPATSSGQTYNVSIQAVPTTIPPSGGGVVNTSTLNIYVTDINDQPVNDVGLYTELQNVIGGGEYLSPFLIYSDASGQATVTFYAGMLNTPSKGVLCVPRILGEEFLKAEGGCNEFLFNGPARTITSSTIDFTDFKGDGGTTTDDAFQPGGWINVNGSEYNDGVYQISVNGVTPGTLTLDDDPLIPWDQMKTESGSNCPYHVYIEKLDPFAEVVIAGHINGPPTAEAGPEQTKDEGVTVTLDGSNSSDPDDNITGYQWLQTGGPNVTLSSAIAVQPIFTAPNVGPGGAALTFELTVTDAGNLTDTDVCTVNITWNNLPPTADAGPDQIQAEGETVTLDSSNSSDPDDGIATYQWLQTDGPNVTLSNTTAVQPIFTAPGVGQGSAALVFELTVTDAGGLTDTDTCTVNVTRDNMPPTADAGPDQTKGESETVTLDGSNSSDPDDGIVGYRWQQVGGPNVTFSNTTAVQPTFTTPEVDAGGAALVFDLTVTDLGGLKDMDTCTVNVTWDNMPPAADAGPNQTVAEGETVTLDGGNSSDPDDGIVGYRWQQVGGPNVTLSSATAVQPIFTTPEVDAGGAALVFELTVTDSNGLTDTDTCTVNITRDNMPPTADAGPDQTKVEGETVTLDGRNSSDPDDGIVSYLWQQTGGPNVTLSSVTAVQPTFTTPEVDADGAALEFELTVTDAGGLTDTSTCTVKVEKGDGGSGGGGCFLNSAGIFSRVDISGVQFEATNEHGH